MAAWDVQVKVWLKPSVFDPQGNAVETALTSLGHRGVSQVRMGKCMTLRIEAATEAEANARLREVCDTMLCNPVMETCTYDLTPVSREELA